MRIRASIATIAVVALVAAAGTRTPSAAEDKTLTIGVLGPLSGGAASYGVELVRGAEMKADEINKAGGLKVGGDVYKIKLVSYDHKALAADAATAANKLVFQDKVKYIIGNAVGATCNAVQTVTEPEKVLFSFVCWGTNRTCTGARRARLSPSGWSTSPSPTRCSSPIRARRRSNVRSRPRGATITPRATRTNTTSSRS